MEFVVNPADAAKAGLQGRRLGRGLEPVLALRGRRQRLRRGASRADLGDLRLAGPERRQPVRRCRSYYANNLVAGGPTAAEVQRRVLQEHAAARCASSTARRARRPTRPAVARRTATGTSRATAWPATPTPRPATSSRARSRNERGHRSAPGGTPAPDRASCSDRVVVASAVLAVADRRLGRPLAATKKVGVKKADSKYHFTLVHARHPQGRHREVVMEGQDAPQRHRPGFQSKTATKLTYSHRFTKAGQLPRRLHHPLRPGPDDDYQGVIGAGAARGRKRHDRPQGVTRAGAPRSPARVVRAARGSCGKRIADGPPSRRARALHPTAARRSVTQTRTV